MIRDNHLQMPLGEYLKLLEDKIRLTGQNLAEDRAISENKAHGRIGGKRNRKLNRKPGVPPRRGVTKYG